MQSYNINIIRPADQNNLECYHKVISLTHRILTDATLDQSGPGNNGNEMVTPHFPELKPHHQMLFNVIPKALFFAVSFTS